MKPLSQAELPDAPVRLCAVSEAAVSVIKALQERGIQVLEVKRHPKLAAPVASHPDMLLRPLPSGKLLGMAGLRFRETLFGKGIEVREILRQPEEIYPGDILLNSLILGNFCYGRRLSAAQELLDYCANGGLEFVDCRQGYARCSVAVAGAQLAITADKGLHHALSSRGVECLLIPPGGILLPGYNTGFIGGCCGLLDKDLLAFSGDLEKFCYGEIIMEFLDHHHVRYCSLTAGPMWDIGGIVPLLQKS